MALVTMPLALVLSCGNVFIMFTCGVAALMHRVARALSETSLSALRAQRLHEDCLLSIHAVSTLRVQPPLQHNRPRGGTLAAARTSPAAVPRGRPAAGPGGELPDAGGAVAEKRSESTAE